MTLNSQALTHIERMIQNGLDVMRHRSWSCFVTHRRRQVDLGNFDADQPQVRFEGSSLASNCSASSARSRLCCTLRPIAYCPQ